MVGHLKRHSIAYLALFVALGGTSYAQFASTDGKLRGCVSKKTGVLRAVKAGTKCKRGETAISWNQKGPRGAQGSIGPRGETGLRGQTGLTGPQGAAGEKGDTGTVDTTNFYDKGASDARHGVRVEERPPAIVQSANGSVSATLIDLGDYAVTYNCAKSADPAAAGARMTLRNDSAATIELFSIQGAETTRVSMSMGSANGTSDRALVGTSHTIRWIAPGLDLTVIARASGAVDGPVTCSYVVIGTLS
jgi:hypothetical protein